MKTKILLIGTIVAMSATVMFTSCEKKNIDGCNCTIKLADGDTEKDYFDIEDMKEYYNVSTCSKLESAIKREAEGEVKSISCK